MTLPAGKCVKLRIAWTACTEFKSAIIGIDILIITAYKITSFNGNIADCIPFLDNIYRPLNRCKNETLWSPLYVRKTVRKWKERFYSHILAIFNKLYNLRSMSIELHQIQENNFTLRILYFTKFNFTKINFTYFFLVISCKNY